MSDGFVDRLNGILDATANFPPDGCSIECKRFFGGAAAWADKRIFVSLTPAGLALKLSETDRREMLAAGGRALRYFPKAPVKKDYAVVPDGIAADPAALGPWIARAAAHVLSLPKPDKGK